MIFARLSEDGREALRKNSPSGKLLRRFMENIEVVAFVCLFLTPLKDPEVTDALKCIPRVTADSDQQLPSLLSRFNGRPFLYGLPHVGTPHSPLQDTTPARLLQEQRHFGMSH